MYRWLRWMPLAYLTAAKAFLTYKSEPGDGLEQLSRWETATIIKRSASIPMQYWYTSDEVFKKVKHNANS